MNEQHYGFQDHLTSRFPSQIVIDVTEFCNLACIHCPQSELASSKGSKRKHLDYNTHKKLINEVAEEGLGYCRYLRYTAQGEPLLHPQFFEIIEYAKFNSDVPVNITTNGILLTESKAEKLIASGVDVIDVSIDAFTSETYSRIRRKGILGSTRSNVINLIKVNRENNSSARIVVSFVVQESNRTEVNDFEKFWKDAGVDSVVVRRLHSAGGAKKSAIHAKSKERYPCLYPWERLTLGADGFIYYCPQDWTHGSRISSFNTNTIKDIWQSDFMNRLRIAHLNSDFSDFSFCGQCPDWETTRWPKDGRSYFNMMNEFQLQIQ